MKIKVKTLKGKGITLEVKPDETIGDVRRMVSEKEGTPPERIRLIFVGKILSDVIWSSGQPLTLLDYSITEERMVIHMVPEQPSEPDIQEELVSDSSAARSHKAWEARAKEGDFDEDLHIVDAQSHFHLLDQLEREVVARSEFRVAVQAMGAYDIYSTSDPHPEDPNRIRLPDSYAWLVEKLDTHVTKWRVCGTLC